MANTQVPEDARRGAARNTPAAARVDTSELWPDEADHPAEENPHAYVTPAIPPTEFVISAAMQGFPFTTRFTGNADTLARTVKRLVALGATPPVPLSPAVVFVPAPVLPDIHMGASERPAAAPVTNGTPAAHDAPTAPAERHPCPVHGGTMKESTKVPGTYHCTRKRADGEYCTERWPKEK